MLEVKTRFNSVACINLFFLVAQQNEPTPTVNYYGSLVSTLTTVNCSNDGYLYFNYCEGAQCMTFNGISDNVCSNTSGFSTTVYGIQTSCAPPVRKFLFFASQLILYF